MGSSSWKVRQRANVDPLVHLDHTFDGALYVKDELLHCHDQIAVRIYVGLREDCENAQLVLRCGFAGRR